MRRRFFLTPAALALGVGVLLLVLTAHNPAAHAAPAASPAAKPGGANIADLLNGRLYPNTLKRSALAPAYHYVTLIDGQGKPAECATKGDTITLAGETFLVAYLLFDAPKPASATEASPPPPDAQLTLINMHYVQALGGIRDTPTPPAPPVAVTPSAAQGTVSTPGTAAP